MYKKYIAEGIGTFALAFIVIGTAAVVAKDVLPLPVPLIASLTLGLFVYTIGSISGCHINPAVTIGLLSVKKIEGQDAVLYVLSQMVGAVFAVLLAQVFMIPIPAMAIHFDPRVFAAEALGTLFFTFGIASVVYGNTKEQMSGVIVAWSLLFGILIATMGHAFGILNPAVAFALNATSIVYILAPIIGSVAGFQVYRFLADKK